MGTRILFRFSNHLSVGLWACFRLYPATMPPPSAILSIVMRQSRLRRGMRFFSLQERG